MYNLFIAEIKLEIYENNAVNLFPHRFKDKTKNDWYQRKTFEKVPGKYDLLAIDYGAKV